MVIIIVQIVIILEMNFNFAEQDACVFEFQNKC